MDWGVGNGSDRWRWMKKGNGSVRFVRIWRGLWWIWQRKFLLCCGWSESREPLSSMNRNRVLCLCVVFCVSFLCLSLYFLPWIFIFVSGVNFILLFAFENNMENSKGNILRTYVPHFNQRQLDEKNKGQLGRVRVW